MIFREGALGAVAGDDGCAEAFGKLDYVIRAAGGVDLLAEEDHGTPGVAEDVPGAFNLDRVALGDVGLAGAQDLDVGLLAEEVGGDLELDGSWTTLAETDEGFDEMVGNGLDLADLGVPVGDGGEHAQLVLGLVGGHLTGADELGLDVGSHLKNRGTGEVRLAHGSHGVGGAGSGAGEQDAGPAGGAGVAVGHVTAAELEAATDEPDIILAVEQSVEEVQGMYGDDAENCVDALGLEGCDHRLAASHLWHGWLREVMLIGA